MIDEAAARAGLIESIASRVLTVLEDPDGPDSVKGITHRLTVGSYSIVQEALDLLVERGKVRTYGLQSGGLGYALRVCETCGGSGSVNAVYDPFTGGWDADDCPTCNDPAIPSEPEPEPMMTCPMCDGDGDNSGDDTATRRITCPRCQGEGEVENPDYEPVLCGLCGMRTPRPGLTACTVCAG